jgi:(2Fe-2S) ferredoxin
LESPAEDLIRVCLGPRCSSRGSQRLAFFLKDELRKRGIEGQVRIQEIDGFCHGRCNLGPNLFVGRDGLWYAGVSADDLGEIVDAHLIHGRPVSRILGKLPEALTLDDKLPWEK